MFPTLINSINIDKGGRMEIKFNRPLDIDSMISNQNDLKQICYLENTEDKNSLILPYKVINQPEDTLSIYFNFKNHKIPQDKRTYKMRCTTQFSAKKELILPMTIDTGYTFPSTEADSIKLVCNPWAFPKVVDNKCQCSHPYTGTLCEQCVSGFRETKETKDNK